jgi:hypothetical protein
MPHGMPPGRRADSAGRLPAPRLALADWSHVNAAHVAVPSYAAAGGHVPVPVQVVPVQVVPVVPVAPVMPALAPHWHPLRLEADRAMASAMEIAGVNDFSRELALTADKYITLHQMLQDVSNAAAKFRMEWERTGDRSCLGAAQSLEIKDLLLKGLYEMRQMHEEWNTPVASPEVLASVLPFFRDAMERCERQAFAVQFPIEGLQIGLAYLQKQAERTQLSLAGAQGQAAAGAEGAAGAHETCQTLVGLLQRLQHTLAHGPASVPAIQAWHRPFSSVVATASPAAGSRADGPRPPSTPSRHAAAPARATTQATAEPQVRTHAPRTAPRTGPARPTAHRQTHPGGRQPAPRLPASRGRRAGRNPDPQAARTAREGFAALSLEPPVGTRPGRPAAAQSRVASTPPASPHLSPPAAGPSLNATVVVEPVVDAAAEAAAQLRQEQLAALHATLAPMQTLADRLRDAVQAGLPAPRPGARGAGRSPEFKAWQAAAKASEACNEALAEHAEAWFGPEGRDAALRRQQEIGTVIRSALDLRAGPPWAGFANKFAAWQAVAQACDACDALLTWQTRAPSGLDSSDDAVRGLQRDIRKATGEALDGARQAADDTFGAFTETYREALMYRLLDESEAESFAALAAKSREMYWQWQQSPLRPRMTNLPLGKRMEQYWVYAKFFDLMERNAPHADDALRNAEEALKLAGQTRTAMKMTPPGGLRELLSQFHGSCMDMRNDILLDAAHMESLDARDLFRDQDEPMKPVLERSQELSTAFDLVLASDPLPDARAGAPGLPAGTDGGPWAPPASGLDLLARAQELMAEIREQDEQAIKLPSDASAQAEHELQAGHAVLRQMELTAQTAAAIVACFHDLAAALDSTPPADRRDEVRRHAGDATWQKLVSDMRQALKEQEDLFRWDTSSMHLAHGVGLSRKVVKVLSKSGPALRTSLRQVERMQLSLKTLERLLQVRDTAGRAWRDFEQGREKWLFRPELRGIDHDRMAIDLGKDVLRIEQDLKKDLMRGLIREADWQGEKLRLDATGEALARKITSEKFMIQGRFLLAWVDHAQRQDPDPMDEPGNMEAVRAWARDVAQELTKAMANLDKQAPPSGYGGRHAMEKALCEGVRNQLLPLIVDLNRKLKSTAAASSSQA